MSRKLKRVPMDFNWPLRETWEGYVNPHYKNSRECPFCNGTGHSDKYNHYHDQWYGNAPFKPNDRGSVPFTTDNPIIVQMATRNIENWKDAQWGVNREAFRLCELFNGSWNHHLNEDDIAALIESDRIKELTHKWNGEKWVKNDPFIVPTSKQVNDWSLCWLAHDSVNAWVVIKARCVREGIDPICHHCEGEGTVWINKESKDLCEKWECKEPPKGDGFQLWEDTSEGSPVSPVFAALDDLCAWCENGATTFGSSKATKEQWKEMLDEGFVHHTEGNMIFI